MPFKRKMDNTGLFDLMERHLKGPLLTELLSKFIVISNGNIVQILKARFHRGINAEWRGVSLQRWLKLKNHLLCQNLALVMPLGSLTVDNDGSGFAFLFHSKWLKKKTAHPVDDNELYILLWPSLTFKHSLLVNGEVYQPPEMRETSQQVNHEGDDKSSDQTATAGHMSRSSLEIDTETAVRPGDVSGALTASNAPEVLDTGTDTDATVPLDDYPRVVPASASATCITKAPTEMQSLQATTLSQQPQQLQEQQNTSQSLSQESDFNFAEDGVDYDHEFNNYGRNMEDLTYDDDDTATVAADEVDESGRDLMMERLGDLTERVNNGHAVSMSRTEFLSRLAEDVTIAPEIAAERRKLALLMQGRSIVSEDNHSQQSKSQNGQGEVNHLSVVKQELPDESTETEEPTTTLNIEPLPFDEDDDDVSITPSDLLTVKQEPDDTDDEDEMEGEILIENCTQPASSTSQRQKRKKSAPSKEKSDNALVSKMSDSQNCRPKPISRRRSTETSTDSRRSNRSSKNAAKKASSSLKNRHPSSDHNAKSKSSNKKAKSTGSSTQKSPASKPPISGNTKSHRKATRTPKKAAQKKEADSSTNSEAWDALSLSDRVKLRRINAAHNEAFLRDQSSETAATSLAKDNIQPEPANTFDDVTDEEIQDAVHEISSSQPDNLEENTGEAGHICNDVSTTSTVDPPQPTTAAVDVTAADDAGKKRKAFSDVELPDIKRARVDNRRHSDNYRKEVPKRRISRAEALLEEMQKPTTPVNRSQKAKAPKTDVASTKEVLPEPILSRMGSVLKDAQATASEQAVPTSVQPTVTSTSSDGASGTSAISTADAHVTSSRTESRSSDDMSRASRISRLTKSTRRYKPTPKPNHDDVTKYLPLLRRATYMDKILSGVVDCCPWKLHSLEIRRSRSSLTSAHRSRTDKSLRRSHSGHRKPLQQSAPHDPRPMDVPSSPLTSPDGTLNSPRLIPMSPQTSPTFERAMSDSKTVDVCSVLSEGEVKGSNIKLVVETTTAKGNTPDGNQAVTDLCQKSNIAVESLEAAETNKAVIAQCATGETSTAQKRSALLKTTNEVQREQPTDSEARKHTGGSDSDSAADQQRFNAYGSGASSLQLNAVINHMNQMNNDSASNVVNRRQLFGQLKDMGVVPPGITSLAVPEATKKAIEEARPSDNSDDVILVDENPDSSIETFEEIVTCDAEPLDLDVIFSDTASEKVDEEEKVLSKDKKRRRPSHSDKDSSSSQTSRRESDRKRTNRRKSNEEWYRYRNRSRSSSRPRRHSRSRSRSRSRDRRYLPYRRTDEDQHDLDNRLNDYYYRYNSRNATQRRNHSQLSEQSQTSSMTQSEERWWRRSRSCSRTRNGRSRYMSRSPDSVRSGRRSKSRDRSERRYRNSDKYRSRSPDIEKPHHRSKSPSKPQRRPSHADSRMFCDTNAKRTERASHSPSSSDSNPTHNSKHLNKKMSPSGSRWDKAETRINFENHMMFLLSKENTDLKSLICAIQDHMKENDEFGQFMLKKAGRKKGTLKLTEEQIAVKNLFDSLKLLEKVEVKIASKTPYPYNGTAEEQLTAVKQQRKEMQCNLADLHDINLDLELGKSVKQWVKEAYSQLVMRRGECNETCEKVLQCLTGLEEEARFNGNSQAPVAVKETGEKKSGKAGRDRKVPAALESAGSSENAKAPLSELAMAKSQSKNRSLELIERFSKKSSSVFSKTENIAEKKDQLATNSESSSIPKPLSKSTATGRLDLEMEEDAAFMTSLQADILPPKITKSKTIAATKHSKVLLKLPMKKPSKPSMPKHPWFEEDDAWELEVETSKPDQKPDDFVRPSTKSTTAANRLTSLSGDNKEAIAVVQTQKDKNWNKSIDMFLEELSTSPTKATKTNPVQQKRDSSICSVPLTTTCSSLIGVESAKRGLEAKSNSVAAEGVTRATSVTATPAPVSHIVSTRRTITQETVTRLVKSGHPVEPPRGAIETVLPMVKSTMPCSSTANRSVGAQPSLVQLSNVLNRFHCPAVHHVTPVPVIYATPAVSAPLALAQFNRDLSSKIEACKIANQEQLRKTMLRKQQRAQEDQLAIQQYYANQRLLYNQQVLQQQQAQYFPQHPQLIRWGRTQPPPPGTLENGTYTLPGNPR